MTFRYFSDVSELNVYTLATLQLLSLCFVVLVPFQGRSLDSDTLKFIFLMKRRVPKRELPDSQTQMWWSKFIPKLWEGVTEAACMSMYVNATVFSENLMTVHWAMLGMFDSQMFGILFQSFHGLRFKNLIPKKAS